MQGAKSRSLLLAGRQQPADSLKTKLCIFSSSNMPSLPAELDAGLVSSSYMGPCPSPCTPLRPRGSHHGRRAASSGPRSCQGAVTPGPQQPLMACVVAAALRCSPSNGEEAAAPRAASLVPSARPHLSPVLALQRCAVASDGVLGGPAPRAAAPHPTPPAPASQLHQHLQRTPWSQ